MNLIQKALSFLLISKSTKQLYAEFEVLFKMAQQLNLLERDLLIAKDYFKHGEYVLSLDHIATQFYEFDLPVNIDFCDAVNKLALMMAAPVGKYQYLESLILKH